jgi:P-type Cu2+ transporter
VTKRKQRFWLSDFRPAVQCPPRMANCEHCGTAFSAKSADDRFCCRGCEYVAELISDQGFEQFYDLKQGIAVAPVRSRPFEDHDFGWLAAKVAEAEAGGCPSE